jgi:hypothetical protein
MLMPAEAVRSLVSRSRTLARGGLMRHAVGTGATIGEVHFRAGDLRRLQYELQFKRLEENAAFVRCSM